MTSEQNLFLVNLASLRERLGPEDERLVFEAQREVSRLWAMVADLEAENGALKDHVKVINQELDYARAMEKDLTADDPEEGDEEYDDYPDDYPALDAGQMFGI